MSESGIFPLDDALRPQASELIQRRWGSKLVVAHGQRYFPAELLGFAVLQDGEMAGLVTYQVEGDRCEIVTIDSLKPGAGIGRRLVEVVKEAAEEAGCRELWLVTTNDNLDALRFYQRLGFRLVAVHPGAVDQARRIKPEIPRTGQHGIPIRDEIELAMPVGAAQGGAG